MKAIAAASVCIALVATLGCAHRSNVGPNAMCSLGGQQSDGSIVIRCDADCAHQTDLVDGTPRYALVHKLCASEGLPKSN